jgi:hypothetical protein
VSPARTRLYEYAPLGRAGHALQLCFQPSGSFAFAFPYDDDAPPGSPQGPDVLAAGALIGLIAGAPGAALGAALGATAGLVVIP